jgi:hypothetical protein
MKTKTWLEILIGLLLIAAVLPGIASLTSTADILQSPLPTSTWTPTPVPPTDTPTPLPPTDTPLPPTDTPTPLPPTDTPLPPTDTPTPVPPTDTPTPLPPTPTNTPLPPTDTPLPPPVAADDSYSTAEDTALNEAAPGVLANDTVYGGASWTVVLDTNPSHGSLSALNNDGSFTYQPGENYCGPDSFTYHVNDSQTDSNPATVSIQVTCVDDPPQVSVDTTSQTVQYSDYIAAVTVTATDVDSSSLSLSDDAPSALSTSGSCTPSGAGTSCTWTLAGQVLVAAKTYDVSFTISDATTDVTAGTQIIVEEEDATVAFDGSNPVGVPVDGSGDSEPFTLRVRVQEASESGPAAAPGDINLAGVSITLAPVGPGSPVTAACVSTGAVTSYDYGAILTLDCDFGGVPVNTYTASATVSGGYYTGTGEDVLVVYDPDLGFSTGGGQFDWPGTGDRTNFGYTMKYNKKGSNVKGNLLLIRHLPDDAKYRIKSNALYGLALGKAGGSEPYGWASFSGKATYLAPGMIEAEGNHEFTAYVEDRSQPGAGADRFWIQVRDRDGSVIAELSLSPDASTNATTISGGNIVVPYAGGGSGKRAR